MFVAASGYAQVTGRVSGIVVDGTGAAVPDATVSLQLPGSGTAAYTSKTSAAGDFTLLTVNPLTYDLLVDAKGFTAAKVSGIKVDPGRTVDVPQIKLEVAGVTQTVEVSAATQSVQTSNAEISTTISNAQIINLPVMNRSPLGFVLTQAGVNSGAGNTTINGQKVSFTNVTLDGINIQDNFIRTNAVDFLPNMLLLDQVAEVTVSTSNANASSFGGSSQIAFVTPSGTNEYHGNLYISNRNSYFAANSFFNNKSGVKNPFLNQKPARRQARRAHYQEQTLLLWQLRSLPPARANHRQRHHPDGRCAQRNLHVPRHRRQRAEGQRTDRLRRQGRSLDASPAREDTHCR